MRKVQGFGRRIAGAWLAVVVGMLATGTSMAGEPAAYQVGTLKVEQYGNHGRPVILIPGLSSGAWVWKDTVTALEKDHVVYAVTLAGFDGTPAPKGGGNYLAQAESSVIELIRTRKLDKPVLVGHSVGGTLALKIASEQPRLLGAAVSVDGLPVFPMSENMTAAQRTQMAAGMQAKMAAATPAQFQAQQLGYMQKIGVIDPKKAETYARLSARSDAKAVAQYMAEDFALNFRDRMKNADIPVLLVSPYYAADGAASPQPFSEAQKTAYWTSLLGPAPHAKVVSISPARHFVMLDQPEKFQQVLGDFLRSL